MGWNKLCQGGIKDQSTTVEMREERSTLSFRPIRMCRGGGAGEYIG